MDRAAALARVRTAADRSVCRAAEIRARRAEGFAAVDPLVRAYVREKFLLEEGECPGDLLLDWADCSLRKILRLKKEGRLTGDISRGCSGASSVITKKVLLMKAAQEDFGLRLSPQEAAAISTVSQLTEAILQQGV